MAPAPADVLSSSRTNPGGRSVTYWQIAAGADGHSYAGDFLRFGMAFVGGRANEVAMGRVRKGDMVLLKQGLDRILAVGQVVERNGHCTGHAQNEPAKDWLFHYDGWELPAYCYVDWCQIDPERQLKGRPLTRAAIDGVQRADLRQFAKEHFERSKVREPVSLPGQAVPLLDAEILAFLEQRGHSAASELLAQLPKLRQLADYYDSHWDDVREHETRTFLIIPFLRALGWTEKQLKIEMPVPKGRVDVACFDQSYKGRQSRQFPVRIIESKGFSRGLNNAGRQAVGYARHFPRCELAVATNGTCYMAFRSGGEATARSFEPVAYLNLRRPTHRYPLDPAKIGGGLELIDLLLAP